ncbi:MAG: toxin [Microcystis sp. M114S2]|jgi:hypothetical protein|uniref:toxin n=1 Tax=Microcystis TaxID=1125 RepID=UPI0022BC3B37|nr:MULTISPECIES: toxin [Microcystis]MCZ8363838.1 toxin [Microcystis sp. LE19-251.1A]MDJ0530766.1 toxin [Microcystis sp. M53600_WE12]MDJ0545991.1 toxin [Microcystis sp. M53601_WE4]MDJ0558726.1 toxin [Microcystis sp. M53599_WE4]MDJ0566558.1 toxin [Microcystis sp. M49629_WE12]
MKRVRWNQEKNEQLQRERYLSFEMVEEAIYRGEVLDDKVHPNRARYPNQRILIVKLNDYAYEVPYVVNESEIFLKTIIPSRKATKKYLKKGDST